MASAMKKKKDYTKLSQIIFQILREDTELPNKFTSIAAILDSGFDVNHVILIDSLIERADVKYFSSTLNCSILHLATYYINEAILKLLLSRGADFTRKDHKGFTPLLLAFDEFSKRSWQYWDTYKSVFDLLLLVHCEFNNTMNPRYNNGISHFHIACYNSNVKVAKFFLDAGVPVNVAINNDSSIWPGFTALHIAMRNKDKDMVQLLVENGADYNRINADRNIPLHLLNDKEFDKDLFSETTKSFENKSFENECILNLLSTPSVDDFNPPSHIGLTELHICCIKKRGVKECLNGHADINAAVNFDSPIWPGYTPLHFAAHCNLQMVLLLLRNGANLLSKDTSGVTPLDLCIQIYKPSDISSILKTQNELKSFQIQNCANLVGIISLFEEADELDNFLKIFNVNTTLSMNSPLWSGFTFLHLAVLLSQDDTSYVKLCLEHGADYTIQDANKMTALHLAFRLKKKDCVKEILDAHVNNSTNPVDDKNVSHFHIACTAEHLESVENFLRAGVDPDLPVEANLQELIKIYVSPHKSNCVKVGLTSLQNAVFLTSDKLSDSCELSKLLLKYNANPDLPDADGFTWIHREFINNDLRYYEYDKSLWNHLKTMKLNRIAPGDLSYFHIVCKVADLATVKALLPVIQNVNQPITSELLKYCKEESFSTGDTPLHFAALSEDTYIAFKLIKAGADVNAQNADGLSPIHLHLKQWTYFQPPESEIFVKLFYNKKVPDEFGLTRLHVACALIDVPFMKKFLEQGDDPNSKMNSDSPLWPYSTPFEIFVKNVENDVEEFEEYEDAIKLLVAYTLKNIENLVPANQELHGLNKRRKKTSLEDKKRIVNLKGQMGFHFSCIGSDPDIVEKFIKCGLDVNALGIIPRQYKGHGTALHFATHHGNEEIIELLLKSGADIRLEGANGQTPVHVAALEKPETLEIFFRLRKVDIQMKNAFGETLIDCLFKSKDASSNDFLRVLRHGSAKNIDFLTKIKIVKFIVKKFFGTKFELLIKCLLDLNDVDADGRCVIHNFLSEPFYTLKIRKDQFAENIESLLMLSGCELDQQDKDGRTALHLAAENNSLEYVEALLAVGADVNVLDNQGRTPFTCCSDNSAVFELISDHVCKMRHAFLYVSSINYSRDRLHSYFKNMKDSNECLKKMEKFKITKSFSLRDILTKKMLTQFPVMPQDQRECILDYLESAVVQLNFDEWLPLFKMQVRNALKREKFYKQ